MRIRVQTDIDEGVAHLIARCEIMRAMGAQVESVPLRLSKPDFAGLASIIVSQQVSKASAAAIFARLQSTVNPLTAGGFLEAGEASWVAVGLSRAKQSTLSSVAAAVQSGTIQLERFCDLEADEALRRLTDIKGIGPWTAEVYLMFCAGHRDVFPAGDLALQEAIRLGFGLSERPDEKYARKIAERWSPHRAVAARVLWAYYALIKRDAEPF